VPERQHAGVERAGVAGADELADAADDDAAAVDDLDAPVVERDGKEGGEWGEVALAPLLFCFFEFGFGCEKRRNEEKKRKSNMRLTLSRSVFSICFLRFFFF